MDREFQSFLSWRGQVTKGTWSVPAILLCLAADSILDARVERPEAAVSGSF